MSSNAPHRLSPDRPPDWLDEIIAKARERGDFDNLPGHGKPLDLPPESSAPSEFDLAYTMLSNAGFAPHWMELGKEAERLEANLIQFRERAANEISELRAEWNAVLITAGAQEARSSWWRRFLSGSSSRRSTGPGQITRDVIEHRRQTLRRQHQEMAEKLDTKVATYHAAMPRELWHVQRVRTAPEEWGTIFDTTCPPTGRCDLEKS